MGLKQQQMGEGFRSSSTRRVLDCAACWSPRWWRVQAAFHICCLHMGNLTLPLSRRPQKNPIISSASVQNDCLRLPQHFLSLSFLCCPLPCHPLCLVCYPYHFFFFPHALSFLPADSKHSSRNIGCLTFSLPSHPLCLAIFSSFYH